MFPTAIQIKLESRSWNSLSVTSFWKFPEIQIFHKQEPQDGIEIETGFKRSPESFPETTQSRFYDLTRNQSLRTK